MRARQWISARLGRGVVVVFGMVVAFALLARAAHGSHVTSAVAQDESKLESTIFTFDGKDFVRSKTTLMTEDGKSAVNTKLDHSNPAYKALIKKHSFVGEATAFGHTYDAEYAPVTGADGKLTGALFVGVPK
jgi:cache 3/cache 2 fusion protein